MGLKSKQLIKELQFSFGFGLNQSTIKVSIADTFLTQARLARQCGQPSYFFQPAEIEVHVFKKGFSLFIHCMYFYKDEIITKNPQFQSNHYQTWYR